MPIRVAVVDDDQAVLSSLRFTLSMSGDFACAGCYPSATEALEQIPRNRPDVTVMDVRMPEVSGIECTAKLKAICPQLRIMILTALPDLKTLIEGLLAGASGYLLKPSTPQEFLDSLREVASGGAPLSREIRSLMVRSYNDQRITTGNLRLSPREREILTCMFERLSNKEIATRLKVKPSTLHTHINRMYKKWNVASRDELIGKFLGRG